MPQFDFYSFSGQTFWFLLSFLIFYFLFIYFYIAPFAEMLKMRNKLFYSYNSLNITNNKFFFKLNLYDRFFIKVFKS